MNDIGLFFCDKAFDLVVEADDLKADDGLETSVAISVFTDKRVDDEDLPDLETSKRGWWGDMFPEFPNDQIGSRLWLINREKTTTETLRRSEDYIVESLNWMLEDGVAKDVNASSVYNENNWLISAVEIEKPDGESTRFQINWEQQEIRRQ